MSCSGDNSIMIRAAHFYVTGHVQGVFFRQRAREQADRFGLTGWVRNLPDGRVEGFAQGPGPALESLRHWLLKGPPLAQVLHLEWNAAPAEKHAGFEVRR